eukprot:5385681-Amphidinium_carterae.1
MQLIKNATIRASPQQTGCKKTPKQPESEGKFWQAGRAPVRPSNREERKAPWTSVLSDPGGERESSKWLQALGEENGEIDGSRREAPGTSVLIATQGAQQEEKSLGIAYFAP